jgi:hypothetical protein
MKIRVLRETTTQWAVFAFMHEHGALIEEPIGAVAMNEHARFVPFVALWAVDNRAPVMNEVAAGVNGFATLKEAAAAVVKAKETHDRFLAENLKSVPRVPA